MVIDKLEVNLDTRSYPIIIGEDLDFKSYIKNVFNKKDILIVSNYTIEKLHLSKLLDNLQDDSLNIKCCLLEDGEQFKDINSYMKVQTALIEYGFSRDCLIIAFGGGVIGDIAGFVASTYQRGVAFMQIPTTILAMVDSSVGGKTAINHPLGKNMIGSFYQPKSVLIDCNFISTLDIRQIRAGFSEILKYAIIYDKEFFDFLSSIDNLQNLTNQTYAKIILKCCSIKAQIVSMDEKEHGQRALLNLGHTFGHVIENKLGYGTLLHGEAVAIGMGISAFVAYKQNLLTKEQLDTILGQIKKMSLALLIPNTIKPSDFIKLMHHDKKVLNNNIRYILPVSIGKACVFDNIEDKTMEVLLSLYNEYCANI